MNNSKEFLGTNIIKYFLLFLVISLIFTSCNVEENDVKENSSSMNLTQEVETTNDNIVIENDIVQEIDSDENEVSSEDGEGYENLDENTRELIEKANGGDNDAMNTLASYYFNGFYVEQDYQKSLDWSIQSAEGGNLASMFNVGYNYYYGYTGEVDYDLAFEWYERAAKQMFPKALNALGHIYYEGLGVEKNVDKALEYTLQSAGFLHNYSLSNMGTIIDDEGLDGESNFWYRLAAKNYMIPSDSNSILYDNIRNGLIDIAVEEDLSNTKIPSDLIEDILYKYYSGTLYDYLETESLEFRDFDVNELNIDEQTLQMISPYWWYDNIYMVDLNDDGIDEILSYIMEGSGGGITVNLLQNVDDDYLIVDDFSKLPIQVGINGLINYEGKIFFVVANVDIGNRVIYGVNIYSFDGLQIDESVTIELKETDTIFFKSYQANDNYNDLNEMVEFRINEMFYDKYDREMLYEDVNDVIILDIDVNNDGENEYYEYESLFWGTINQPIFLEFKDESSDEDLLVINEVLSFNDLGTPIGIEIFTLEGINYIGVLSYELSTNNHCLTTFKLEKDEMTVVLNHFITFDEKFIVN